MKNAIEVWAPWMSADEARQLIDSVTRTPDYLRKITARKMGERLNLQNWERERLGLRTIAPVDMTPDQLREQRKVKDRARKWRSRRAAKKQPREVYLDNSINRQRPWKAENISRATWYRRHRGRVETSVSAIKLIRLRNNVSHLQGESS